jgi:UDP-N-acetylglucosamine--N-acetylmuramyl-(pentapeptide) pyrophosphoryl-undecaprenol N-acetylglucosamine transferase
MNMQNESIHIVFFGGGTGGHLFPGLAVAEQFAAAVPSAKITFAGNGKTFEQHHVVRAGFDYFTLPSRPLPTGAGEAVAFVVESFAGYLAASRFLRENNVATVVGLGGVGSVPMAKAALGNRIPLVLLEQNVIPSRTTRWLSRKASLVCTSFEQTQERLPGQCSVRWTGNPVRGGFRRGDALTQQPKQLVILGGNGEARALNECVPRALYKLRNLLPGWSIIHQSGEADLTVTEALYQKLVIKAQVVPFLGNMSDVLAMTDLVISRAGGTALAELAATGVPGVLLPSPLAPDDHQLANAQAYAEAGGALVVDERTAKEELDNEIAMAIASLLVNDTVRQNMSAAMYELARPTAAADVAELIWSIVSSRSRCAELTPA